MNGFQQSKNFRLGNYENIFIKIGYLEKQTGQVCLLTSSLSRWHLFLSGRASRICRRCPKQFLTTNGCQLSSRGPPGRDLAGSRGGQFRCCMRTSPPRTAGEARPQFPGAGCAAFQASAQGSRSSRHSEEPEFKHTL